MVSKNQLKFIKSLQQKKCRIASKSFMVEGEKVIAEFLASDYKLQTLCVTREDLFPNIGIKKELISPKELQRISALKAANTCLAVFEMKPVPESVITDWTLVLDDVKDPGNLGTIIRLCDWFGITQLVCSKETVDVYNPKVVQSTMGALARMQVVYTDLEPFLAALEIPIYTAEMKGTSVNEHKFHKKGVLVMGSESHGVSAPIRALSNNSITIPRFGSSETESLNVATATAILLHEIRKI